ncbi:hypothetical protein JHN55_02090 [Streptomyces sp. MBT56]|uniref:hypothetical protein n=1 Tax=unclassified Streptomyces TaxID=2593676 RepID=UPI00190D6141|nr:MULTISPECIES: hypothetical protein [unclassified Streptomyces]MBK3555348.1 hypothetical protein [Streptomyces sp. MBT56]MBK3604265.1 hypothetical protein [Streptomyces sp. MBT54]MBK3616303.1 hypothetical protein [Streptomyces sp. MBT98]MBK6046030.1 hypothetical protein [Streptomyces sp. MBT55]
MTAESAGTEPTHSLDNLHLAELPEDQAEKVRRAYGSWGNNLRAMPGHLTRHASSSTTFCTPSTRTTATGSATP